MTCHATSSVAAQSENAPFAVLFSGMGRRRSALATTAVAALACAASVRPVRARFSRNRLEGFGAARAARALLRVARASFACDCAPWRLHAALRRRNGRLGAALSPTPDTSVRRHQPAARSPPAPPARCARPRRPPQPTGRGRRGPKSRRRSTSRRARNRRPPRLRLPTPGRSRPRTGPTRRRRSRSPTPTPLRSTTQRCRPRQYRRNPRGIRVLTGGTLLPTPCRRASRRCRPRSSSSWRR